MIHFGTPAPTDEWPQATPQTTNFHSFLMNTLTRTSLYITHLLTPGKYLSQWWEQWYLTMDWYF